MYTTDTSVSRYKSLCLFLHRHLRMRRTNFLHILLCDQTFLGRGDIAFCLCGEQLVILASCTHQRGMVTKLGNGTAVENDNLVGDGRGGQTVRDKQRRFVTAQIVKLTEDLLFGDGVKRCCRLVKNQEIGV